MTNPFLQMLRQYGQIVSVFYENPQEKTLAYAFFQPILQKQENLKQVLPTALGLFRQDRFLYLGEPGISLKNAQSLRWNQTRFRIEAAQPIFIASQINHWWAVAVPEEVDGT